MDCRQVKLSLKSVEDRSPNFFSSFYFSKISVRFCLNPIRYFRRHYCSFYICTHLSTHDHLLILWKRQLLLLFELFAIKSVEKIPIVDAPSINENVPYFESSHMLRVLFVLLFKKGLNFVRCLTWYFVPHSCKYRVFHVKRNPIKTRMILQKSWYLEWFLLKNFQGYFEFLPQ